MWPDEKWRDGWENDEKERGNNCLSAMCDDVRNEEITKRTLSNQKYGEIKALNRNLLGRFGHTHTHTYNVLSQELLFFFGRIENKNNSSLWPYEGNFQTNNALKEEEKTKKTSTEGATAAAKRLYRVPLSTSNTPLTGPTGGERNEKKSRVDFNVRTHLPPDRDTHGNGAATATAVPTDVCSIVRFVAAAAASVLNPIHGAAFSR